MQFLAQVDWLSMAANLGLPGLGMAGLFVAARLGQANGLVHRQPARHKSRPDRVEMDRRWSFSHKPTLPRQR
jgi:hypothetical protein